MSATSTLTNLYIPLPIPASAPDNNPQNRTRGQLTLRTLHLSRSPLSQSSGSSLIELGNTKLLVSVRGPRSSGRCSFGKEGGLACEGELLLSCFFQWWYILSFYCVCALKCDDRLMEIEIWSDQSFKGFAYCLMPVASLQKGIESNTTWYWQGITSCTHAWWWCMVFKNSSLYSVSFRSISFVFMTFML